jgi:hypothetical protein
MATISTGIFKFTTLSLYDGIRGSAKRLRESVADFGHWDVRGIELKVVFLVGSQAQCVNVIFNLLILLRFLMPLDRVRYYPADEVCSR